MGLGLAAACSGGPSVPRSEEPGLVRVRVRVRPG